MKRSFVYALEAQNELADIVRYTARQWGAAQARTYAAQLDAAANDLASGQGVFRAWDDVLEGLRVKAVGSHLVFCVGLNGVRSRFNCRCWRSPAFGAEFQILVLNQCDRIF